MKNWWIGCSGFYYKGWRGKFYPEKLPQKKWFEFYCEHFNTVEINMSFYRFPKAEALKGWFERSPEEFRFTVKANRLITHYKKFKDVKRETNDFYEVVSKGLKEKLGTILFQLPPNMAYSEENLERILNTLDPTFANVLEFRHPSWWRTEVYNTLKENNITFCSISYPELPDQVIKTAPVMYYRFHGVPHLYLSSYTDIKLAQVGEDIRRYRNTSEVYCYFNNDIEVAAVDNAKTLMEQVSPSSQRVLSRV